MQKQVNQTEADEFDGAALEGLLKRAEAGDESVVPAVRRFLAKDPEMAQVLGGDLAHNAAKTLVRTIAGENIAWREAIYVVMARRRAELSGPDPGPLERQLVERIVLCWLHVHYADCRFAQAQSTSPRYIEFLQRQQDRAQRRYLAAIKSLAAIRRLNLPILVDVNVNGAVNDQCPRATCRTVTEPPSLSPHSPDESSHVGT